MTTAFRACRVRRAVWLPDRAAVVGVFLAILTYFLGFYQPMSFEPEPYVRLPLRHSFKACFSTPDKGMLIVSLDSLGRYYFATDSRVVQAAAIQRVAAAYGVYFSVRQLQALPQLPYLGLDVRQLPAYLFLSRSEQRQIALLGLPQSYSHDQLTACLLAGRRANIELLNSAPYIVLRADATTKAADIRHFMHALQRQNIHRLQLAYLDY